MDADEAWVEIREYSPRWPAAFAAEAEAIRAALGDYAIAIKHFGSTAVPGLAAKPIVDILIGVADGSDPALAIESLGKLDYEYLGEDGRPRLPSLPSGVGRPVRGGKATIGDDLAGQPPGLPGRKARVRRRAPGGRRGLVAGLKPADRSHSHHR